MNNTPFIVAGTGAARRQFIYAPDLAKLIIWALDSYDETEPIILCADESSEVRLTRSLQCSAQVN